MAGEVTNAELGRRLDEMRSDIHEDLRELKQQVDKLVPREVYDAQRSAMEARIANLEATCKALGDQWRGAIRWVVGTVAVPVVVLIVQILLTIKGVKP